MLASPNHKYQCYDGSCSYREHTHTHTHKTKQKYFSKTTVAEKQKKLLLYSVYKKLTVTLPAL